MTNPGLWLRISLLSLGGLACAARSQAVLYSVSGAPGAPISGGQPSGDFDADGVREFSVFTESPAGGTVDLRSGATGALLHHFTKPAGLTGASSYFGIGGIGQGDVNADGVPDFIIGVPFGVPAGGPVDCGGAYVYSGADDSVIRTHVGLATMQLGFAVNFVGDWNGDGATDYSISARNEATSSKGLVTVYSGVDGHVLRSFLGGPNTGFGAFVVPLDDISGDGVPELVIGERLLSSGGLTNNGAVRAYSGATGTVLKTIVGTTDYSLLGTMMAAVGDVDDDGTMDVALTQYDFTTFADGVEIWSPATGAVLQHMQGDMRDLPGVQAVASAGDVDGDAKVDVVFADSGSSAGQLITASSATGARLFIIPDPGSFFAYPWEIGDTNGDGYPEFVVADSNASIGGSSGVVSIYTTRPLHPSPSTLSISAPGPIELTLSPGVAHAGSKYLVLGSLSPEGPGCGGFDVGPLHAHVPFCFDVLMDLTLSFANTPVLQNTFGLLDGTTGQGSAVIDASGAVLPPAAAGIQMHFFFLTTEPGGPWDKAWQSAAIEIVP